MMKVLQKLLLLMAITVGFSLTAMAQRDQKKDPPPKEKDPPKIKVEPKRDRDKPKNDNRDNDRRDDRRKPEMALLDDSGDVEII